jgi:Peptidase A4 family
MRLPMVRYLLIPGSAAVVVGALTLAGGAAVTTAAPARAAHPAYHAPSARFLAQARKALVGYLRHSHPQIEFVHPGAAQPGIVSTTKTVDSFNWSGYADATSTKGTFTRVSGSWTTPSVTCSAEDQITSEWVGLDGYNDSTVEQDGTVSWCYQDVPTYFTWYEMFPAATVEVGTSLAPGDLITATVSRSGKKYTLKVTDSTNPANSFTHKATCKTSTCLDKSAEWISERPAFEIGIAPLADYGTWSLTGASERARGTTGTISSYKHSYKIKMLDATEAYFLATPSALTDGSSFTTTWENSY